MAEPPLVDRLLQTGKLAFDPDQPEEARQQNLPQFKAIIDGTGTLALMPALNLLVQPGRSHPWLRSPVISALALLPLRPRGVQDTIEFILSVHPSSRVGSSEETSKRSGISYEALNAATRLLCAPPTGMAPENWFSGIAPQLFSLLQGQGEPGMDKAAAFIIGFGILGRKQYGEPGKPGWESFAEPMLRDIDPTITLGSALAAAVKEDIITLGAPKILVSSENVSLSLRNMLTLVTSHPNPGLAKRLLRPILLPLWSLSSWYGGDQAAENAFCRPARELLKILVQLWPSANKRPAIGTGPRPTSYSLSIIVQNLLFEGRSNSGKVSWEYALSKDGGIQVQQPHNSPRKDMDMVSNMARIDHAVEKFTVFLKVLESTPEFTAEVSSLFMDLCSKWLSNSDKQRENLVVTHLGPSEGSGDIESRLIEARVMQKLMDVFPDKLVSNSKQVLGLVDQVLSDFAATNGGHNNGAGATAIALSLLNMLLNAPGFQMSSDDVTIDSIQSSLKLISQMGNDEVSPTAKSLLPLLMFCITVDESQATPNIPMDQTLEDRKSYNLAMSYLMATESPPPVRVQGLEILSTLIRTNSSVLDIPALLVLFTSVLQDNEEYIYLRAIQSLIQLSEKHPKAVMNDLIDRYVDSNEQCELDQRLRLGEALLQVMQTNFVQFINETASSVCRGLLFVSGRRGYRPKTEREQEKRFKIKKKADAEAEEAWDGEVPQLDEDEIPEENEILAQIVSGWESKRGAEDIRIRASALSILGSALESNIAGIGASIASAAIDMGIHILTLEPELQKAILRRAAILLIMSFIRTLDAARSEGTKLGFGFVGQSLDDVARILEYVKDTDNDELVRQHATDVVENLHAWQMNSLFPAAVEPRSEIQELAGLHIRPGGDRREGQVIPRIEEIE